MKKILLIGIGGVYNYGCEAIVRGTVNVLKEKNPSVEIYYASRRVGDDRKRLVGCDIKIIDATISKWTLKNIIRKLLSFINIEYSFIQENKSILKGIDEVYSIGGDIYTLDASNNYSKSLPLFGDYCIKKGIKYNLWGCSVGPFEANDKALSFFKTHLKNATRIYAREKETVDYLRKLDIVGNVELVVDPAFFVATHILKTKANSGIKRIGINLSPLSSLHYYESLDDAIDIQTKWIYSIVERFNCNITLIPHVISDSINDDDFRYLRRLYLNLSDDIKSRVTLIDTDPGFIGVKQEIIKCDVIMAARMHCAINSIVTNTPVIFLAYSKKAIGMADFIYGNDRFVFELDNILSKDFLDRVEEVSNLDLINLSSK